MQSILLVAQVLISISLIALILLQHGKGADAGAAFGSGASATVFGSSGSASFLSRTTAILATLFFAVSLSLSVLAHRQTQEQGIVDKYVTPTEQAVEKLQDAGKEINKDVPPVPGAKNQATDSEVPAAVPEARVPKAPATDVPVAPSVTENPDVPTAPADKKEP